MVFRPLPDYIWPAGFSPAGFFHEPNSDIACQQPIEDFGNLASKGRYDLQADLPLLYSPLWRKNRHCASVAQLAEHRFCKPEVVGSIPTASL